MTKDAHKPTDRIATCQCGRLRLTTKGEPASVFACSCLACQRSTGSPFRSGAWFPKEAVSIEGVAQAYRRTADSGRDITMHFCPACGSTVYWRASLRPGFYGVAVGCFADPSFPEPSRVIWNAWSHRWISFPQDAAMFPAQSGGPSS